MSNIKTLQEVAQLWEVNDGGLRSAIKNDRLPATKSAGTWLIDLDDPAVIEYHESYRRKVRKSDKGICPVCGKPLPRARAKYCSQECYGEASKKE